MIESEYLEHLRRGKKIFLVIGNELNSCKFVRSTGRSSECFNEICVALSILFSNINKVSEESLRDTSSETFERWSKAGYQS